MIWKELFVYRGTYLKGINRQLTFCGNVPLWYLWHYSKLMT